MKKSELFLCFCFFFTLAVMATSLQAHEVLPTVKGGEAVQAAETKTPKQAKSGAQETKNGKNLKKNKSSQKAVPSESEKTSETVKRGVIYHDAPTVLQPSIELFDAINPLADETKSDGYWDLAWHARAADYGDMHSQYLVAQAYEYGKHTPVNLPKALEFYKKAAQQGHYDSCMKLGLIYTENKWVKADPDQALFWYEQAAKDGYIPAQLKLSDIYLTREKPDYVESYYWLGRATKQMFPHEPDLEAKAPKLAKIADHLTPDEYESVLIRVEK